MEGNFRGHTTPKDLGVRAQLLVEKHAAYIKKVADVSCASCKRMGSRVAHHLHGA
jgi:hypothetical protein